MSWPRKKKWVNYFPELTPPTAEPQEEEPPFPVDKPNSCEYCEHHKWNYSGQYCEINNKEVYVVGHYPYRTWDRCDKYSPMHICKTCKHYSPKIITVMDEAFEEWRDGCTREGGYKSCVELTNKCTYQGWEAKE